METEFTGRNLIFLPEVDSTNSYAMQLLKNVKPPEGTIVYAGHQSEGKGQRGNIWISQPDCNLTMSVVYYPDFLKVHEQHYLYQFAALACYDTIAEILGTGHFDIKIKWPNDILVNSRKICGILIENNLLETNIISSVVGIGLNINQTEFPFLQKVTSMRILQGKSFIIKQVLNKVADHMDRYYGLLRSGKFSQIQKHYEKLLFAKDQWIVFESSGSRIEYKVKGLGADGLLMLENREGGLIKADVKQLRWNY